MTIRTSIKKSKGSNAYRYQIISATKYAPNRYYYNSVLHQSFIFKKHNGNYIVKNYMMHDNSTPNYHSKSGQKYNYLITPFIKQCHTNGNRFAAGLFLQLEREIKTFIEGSNYGVIEY